MDKKQEFLDKYEKLCKKYGYQIAFTPRFEFGEENKFHLTFGFVVEEIKNG